MTSSPVALSRANVQRVRLEDKFDGLQLVSGGAFGAVVVGRCRNTGQLMRLRQSKKNVAKFADFRREYGYSRFLSAHPCVVNTFEVTLETADAYIFVQELPPAGDLRSVLDRRGVGVPLRTVENECKLVAAQVLSALEFMHGEGLVHRDVRPENILLFAEGCRVVKLAGFALTCRAGAVVRRPAAECTPYQPPEQCERLRNEGFEASAAGDVWAVAVVALQLLVGEAPWDAATAQDKRYASFSLWHKHQTMAMPAARWRLFTPKLLKMLRQSLEPSESRRCSAADMAKYARSRWMQEVGGKAGSAPEDDGDDERDARTEWREGKAILKALLVSKGVPSVVTKRSRLAMIHEWLSSSESLNRLSATPEERRRGAGDATSDGSTMTAS